MDSSTMNESTNETPTTPTPAPVDLGTLSDTEAALIRAMRGDNVAALSEAIVSTMQTYLEHHPEQRPTPAPTHAQATVDRLLDEQRREQAEMQSKPAGALYPKPGARDVPRTTVNPNDDTYPDELTQNFRKAFAVVGALIADGFIDVDFSDDHTWGGWWNGFELAVNDVAGALNITAMV